MHVRADSSSRTVTGLGEVMAVKTKQSMKSVRAYGIAAHSSSGRRKRSFHGGQAGAESWEMKTSSGRTRKGKEVAVKGEAEAKSQGKTESGRLSTTCGVKIGAGD